MVQEEWYREVPLRSQGKQFGQRSAATLALELKGVSLEHESNQSKKKPRAGRGS